MDAFENFTLKKSFRDNGISLPLGKDVFSLEKHTRSVEDVLAELGFNPFILNNKEATKIRIIPTGAQGGLTTAIHFGEQSVHKGDHGACALRRKPKSADPFNNDTRYIIAPDPKSYKHHHTLAITADIPARLIEDFNGKSEAMQALIIAHELEHFQCPPTMEARPSYNLMIETLCDTGALSKLYKTLSPDVFEDSAVELKHARAIAGVMDYIYTVHLNKRAKGNLLDHATALMIDPASQGIFDEDFFEKAAITANLQAGEKICALMEPDLDLNLYFDAYIACKKILQSEPMPPYALRVVQLFVEAAEYFSPEGTNAALEKSGFIALSNNLEDIQSQSAVSLEI